MRQEDSFWKQLFAPKKLDIDSSDPYYEKPMVKTCLKLITNPLFDFGILMVIVFNTIVLALDQDPPLDEDTLTVLSALNLIFTGIFVLEAVVKIGGLGVRPYARDNFNMFDFIVVVTSLVSLGFENQGPFSAMRAFRLFKIFRLLKVGDLRILIDSISFTVITLGDYVILLMLFMYIFALLGMSYFAGKLKINELTDEVDHVNGISPRANFDSLGWSLLTVFQVLMNEKWTQVMFDTYRCVSMFPAALYYIFLVFGGNIIMLNLLLAILLGNFEKARDFGLKKRIFDAFQEMRDSGLSLNQAVDLILGDLAFHTKVKILGWDACIV